MREQSAFFHRYNSQLGNNFNQYLIEEYLKIKDLPEVDKSHFFGGRFENVYIDRYSISGLDELLNETVELAAKILDTPSKQLKLGFWFNEMHHGHSTTAHTHDEDDELLSGVYYIQVPENSGELVLDDENDCDSIRISPKAGEYIFFAPDCLHSVSENQSSEMRLSIGINIGPKE